MHSFLKQLIKSEFGGDVGAGGMTITPTPSPISMFGGTYVAAWGTRVEFSPPGFKGSAQ